MKKRNDDILFGFHSVMEAMKANKTIDKVLIKRGLRGELYQECFSLIRKYDIPFQYVPIETLNRVTRANHQGIIAFVSAINYYDITQLLPGIYESGKDPFLLFLDGVTDIRNFGAIARSAESAGVDVHDAESSEVAGDEEALSLKTEPTDPATLTAMPAKEVSPEIVEQPVWGLDCYTVSRR